MFVKKFKDLSKKDVNIAGGKGASLGEMYNSNIPVPNGFVVLSNAFDEFTEKTRLTNEIENELIKVDINKVETVENASEKIILAILKKEFPEKFKQSINKKFDELNTKFVAVRSSATSEDSSDAAWAGQLDTFLNTTKENLLENIKKCWASLFTPRAIFYRFEKKLDKTDVSVAVVIQKMVASQISGIAFSVHPITEDYNQILIEAGIGLGEAIVSGQITPDNYVIRKNDLEIEAKNISEQNKALFRGENGGVEWKNVKENSQKLSDEWILKLSKIIIHIEDHYGFPCDIEWAYENKELYITQSRPITTLTNLDSKKQEIEKKDDESNSNHLADEFIKELNEQSIVPPQHNSSIFVQASGWNFDKYFKEKYHDKTPLPVLVISKGSEGIMYYPFTKLVELCEEYFDNYWNDPTILTRIIETFEKHKEKSEKIYLEINKITKNEKEINNLYGKLEEIYTNTVELNAVSAFSFYFDKNIFEKLILKYKINISDKNKVWGLASKPVTNSFNKQRETYLLELISSKKSFNDIINKCRYFGADYGHIESEKELGKRLKQEYKEFINNPEKAKEKITTYKNELAARTKERERELKKLNKDELKIIYYINKIIELRDLRKDLISKMTLQLFLACEIMFDKFDVSKELIYFYRMDEIIKGEKYFKSIISELKKRKEGYSCLLSYNGTIKEENNFEINKKILEEFVNSKIKPRNKIKGQVAHKGLVKGKVRVVRNKEEFKYFEDGEVLVTGMTRPEFIPLMKKSIAIVTDEGGVTSHAAIISRELKKPCLIGTKDASRILKTGDLVEVDANKGIVKILEKK